MRLVDAGETYRRTTHLPSRPESAMKDRQTCIVNFNAAYNRDHWTK